MKASSSSFNALDSDGVASGTLQVDGHNVTPVYGPYSAASGVNFGVLLGTLSAGAHTYTIVARDNLGNSTTPAYTGTFNVVTATNNGPTISAVTVLTDLGVMTWNALDAAGVASASLTIDGANVTKIYGPFTASSGVNFGADFVARARNGCP